KAPGYYGRYLALSGETINGDDAIFINAADYLIPSERVNDVLNIIKETKWNSDTTSDNIKDKLATILNNEADDSLEENKISRYEAEVNKEFANNTVEEIIASLEAETKDFANETKKTILSMSPVSLKVALKHVIDSENKTLKETLIYDEVIAKNFLNHNKYYESFRSV